MERQIQDMLQQGIIKPPTSRMASPLVIVEKKDGSLRLACDYRYINSFTIECQYQMPIAKDVLNKVGKSTIIYIFDCRSAYWTCPVKESDQRGLVFPCNCILYKGTRFQVTAFDELQWHRVQQSYAITICHRLPVSINHLY